MQCSPQVRCLSPKCPTCAWKFTGRLTARISGTPTGQLCATEIEIPNPHRFREWRVEARNFLDHRRRKDILWRRFGCHVFLSKDGWLRGVMTLGQLGLVEVSEAFSTRWSTTLRVFEPGDLRMIVWAALKPSVIYTAGPPQGRYWPLRCSIWPCRRSEAPMVDRSPSPDLLDPMPVLF